MGHARHGTLADVGVHCRVVDGPNGSLAGGRRSFVEDGEVWGKNGYLLVAIMDQDELRHHIDLASPFGHADSRRLTLLIIRACWPGGPEDRTEPLALDALRRWHPVRSSAELPECSCDTGQCVLCN